MIDLVWNDSPPAIYFPLSNPLRVPFSALNRMRRRPIARLASLIFLLTMALLLRTALNRKNINMSRTSSLFHFFPPYPNTIILPISSYTFAHKYSLYTTLQGYSPPPFNNTTNIPHTHYNINHEVDKRNLCLGPRCYRQLQRHSLGCS